MDMNRLKTVVEYHGIDGKLIKQLLETYPYYQGIDIGKIRRLFKLNDGYVYSYRNPHNMGLSTEYAPFQYYTREQMIEHFQPNLASHVKAPLPKREFMQEAMIKMGIR